MASFSVPCPNASSIASGSLQPALKQQQQQRHCSISFQSDPKPKATLLAGSSLDHSAFLRFQGPRKNQSDAFKVGSMLNEVAVEKSSNSVAFPLAKSEEPAKESNTQSTLPDASSISAFMTQVADLVKLVDSRDITELQLKQQDCEVLIRKREALPQQPAVLMQPSHPQAIVPSQVPPAQLTSPASAGSVPSPLVSAPAPPSPAKPKSSHPPLKCPMAGTFYRSPSPGAPPFVKVGDKVQKGQVVCIIEAMKLMNEIEADQSGTIVEILVDDGKSVSLDMPLFVIEP